MDGRGGAGAGSGPPPPYPAPGYGTNGSFTGYATSSPRAGAVPYGAPGQPYRATSAANSSYGASPSAYPASSTLGGPANAPSPGGGSYGRLGLMYSQHPSSFQPSQAPQPPMHHHAYGAHAHPPHPGGTITSPNSNPYAQTGAAHQDHAYFDQRTRLAAGPSTGQAGMNGAWPGNSPAGGSGSVAPAAVNAGSTSAVGEQSIAMESPAGSSPPDEKPLIKSAGRKRARSSGNKEVADGDDSVDGKGDKGSKRNRVHFSCTECHRRKQKCNRETPCNHCIARKVPEKCKVFQPGEDASDIQSRVGRLEKLCESYLPAILDKLEDAAKRHESLEERLKQREAAFVAAPPAAAGPWPGDGRERVAGAGQDGLQLPPLAASGLGTWVRPSSRGGLHSTSRPGSSSSASYRFGAGPSNARGPAEVGGLNAVAAAAAAVAAAAENDLTTDDAGRLDPQTGSFLGSGAVSMRIGRLLDALPTASGQGDAERKRSRAKSNATAPSANGRDEAKASSKAGSTGGGGDADQTQHGHESGAQDAAQENAGLSDLASASQAQRDAGSTDDADDNASAAASARAEGASVSDVAEVSLGDPVRTLESGPCQLEEALAEYGVMDGESAQLLAALPSEKLARKLIDHYFNDINWMRAPMPRKMLLKLFDDFWKSGPKLTIRNINIFAVLMSTCALAFTSAPFEDAEHGADVSADPEERARTAGMATKARMLAARKLNYAAHRALLASATLGVEDLHRTMALVQSTKFLFLDRRIGEAYLTAGAAAKSAFSLGLHRDGSKLDLSHEETQRRRIAWGVVFYGDKTLALNLGRPSNIPDTVCDTEGPTAEELDEEYPHPVFEPEKPLAEGVPKPTCMLYSTFRHRIGLLMSRCVDCYQELHRPAHYKDVLAIDSSLEALRASLPYYFRCKLDAQDEIEVDTSLDKAFPYLPVQRFLIEAEINFLRIALHRPFLLRSAGSHGARYIPSRRACIQAAHFDLRLRNYFVRFLRAKYGDGLIPLHFRVHLGTYKWFNSLLICGIVLLIEPMAQDAAQLKSHLSEYIKRADELKAKGIVRDDIREKEANILRLFTARIEQLQEQIKATRAAKKRSRAAAVAAAAANEAQAADKAAKSKASAAGKPDDEAGLLLGLGQGQQETTPTSTTNMGPPGSVESANALRPILTATSNGSPVGTTPSMNGDYSQLSPVVQSATDDAQRLFDNWYQGQVLAGEAVLTTAFGQQESDGSREDAGVPSAGMGASWGMMHQPPWLGGASGAPLNGGQDVTLTAAGSGSSDAAMTPYLQAVRATAGMPSDGLNDEVGANFQPADASNTEFWQDLIKRIAP